MPFFLCEYAHAMGNGPGGLGDFWELFSAHENLHGGFVWEWKDHGVAIDADAARTRPASGRSGSRTAATSASRCTTATSSPTASASPTAPPAPGLRELQHAAAPVRIEAETPGGRRFRVTSRFDHRDTASLAWRWTHETADGDRRTGTVAVPTLGPGETAVVELPDAEDEPAGIRTLEAVEAEATPWADAGHAVAFGQSVAAGPAAAARPTAAPTAAWVRGADAATLDLGAGAVVAVDGLDGTLRVRAGGVELLHLLPGLNLWRAPVDNEHSGGGGSAVHARRLAACLHVFRPRVDAVEVVEGGALAVRGSTLAAARGHGFRHTLRLTPGPAGVLHLDVAGEPAETWPEQASPPRIGLRASVPASLSAARWRGLGPGESYPDSRAAAQLGTHSATAEEMDTPYLFPQDHGGRGGCTSLDLGRPGDTGPTLGFTAADPFAFSLLRYDQERLTAATHRHHLVPDPERLHLHLDHRVRGLGSASCGPPLPPRYEVAVEPFAFSLTLHVRPS